MAKEEKTKGFVRDISLKPHSLFAGINTPLMNQFLVLIKTIFLLPMISICIGQVDVYGEVEERTVIDNERGGYWGVAFNNENSELGIYMYGAGDWGRYKKLPDEMIKGVRTNLIEFHLPGSTNAIHFLAEELLAFEADEVAQGREPFCITATYNGYKKPVIYTWPWRSKRDIRQALNIGDERLIKFLVNAIRTVLDDEHLQNWALFLDHSAFRQEKWCIILDDEGNFSNNVRWDRPFPQNDREYAEAGKHFYRRLKELAPDIIIIKNGAATPAYPHKYEEVYGPTDGLLLEGFMCEYISPMNILDRDDFWEKIQRIIPPEGPDAYKIQLFFDCQEDGRDARQKFLAYLIFSGPNGFFKPSVLNNWLELDPSLYARMKNALGSPSSYLQSQRESGKTQGYRLFWRNCEGGIIYLNMTGLTKTLVLPEDCTYYDPNGDPITSITLADKEAGYAIIDPSERVAKPRINPRRPNLVTGPLTITLETEPFSSDSKIFYTLDGSEPDEGSKLYTEPFEIHESCVVKARAYDGRNTRFQSLPSFTNFATYKLTDEEPTVEFHYTSERGSEFLDHDYPVVSLSRISAHPVVVKYMASGGTAENRCDYKLVPDVLIIRPGEQHRYFPIRIINDDLSEPDETIEISIYDPINATLGTNSIYTYTIEDNDHDPSLAQFREGFETGDFGKFNWTLLGDEYWTISSDDQISGIYSAKAGLIHDNESTTLKLIINCISGEISFYYKVSSEQHYDYLRFYIDGSLQDEWSGNEDWTETSFDVTAGVRTFEWTYSKDSSSSYGSDTAWIDDVTLPIDD